MRVEAGQGIALGLPASGEIQARPVSAEGPQLIGQRAGDENNLELTNRNFPLSFQDLSAAVGTINKTLQLANYHMEFRLHERSGRYQVKVVESNTGQIIREIPPEQMLDISARFKEILNKMIGVLVDELA